MRLPTEEELKTRIEEHLSWRPTQEIALIWQGYLVGLHEWGNIQYDVYSRLMSLFPSEVGAKEIYELCTGAPITPEAEEEIDEFFKNKSN